MIYKFKEGVPKPFKHQVRALKRAIKQGYIGLLWEPGVSKTRVIVDWACAMHLKEGMKRVIVVAPLSVLGVWEDEFADWATVPYHFVYMDTRTVRLPRYKNGLTVVAVNYELIWRRPEVIKRFAPDMIAVDESHRMKKASSERTKYLRRLAYIPYRAILTGTPTPKSYVDIYAQWLLLNPKRFGTRKDDFVEKYIIYGGFMKHKVVGYHNVQELRHNILLDASIKTKEQCLDLPEQIFQRIPVELEPKAREAYNKMANELYLELKKGEAVDAQNVAVKLLRLQQITGGFVKSDAGNIHQISSAKLDAARDRTSDLLEQDSKVVLVARFRPELDALVAMVAKLRVPTYLVRGGVPREDRDRMRREFQRTPGARVFLIQIQSGGLGITLHSAHDAVLYSVTYALEDYIQVINRLHRPGQTQKVRYQHLVGRNTVDLDIYAALRAKEDVMRIIMGNPRKFAKGLLS